MKPTVVFYPSSGISHLAPSIELAKLITTHNLNALIIIVDSPPDPKISSLISTTSSTSPSISFHHLPPPPPPSNPTSDPLLLGFQLLQLNNPNLQSFLSHLSQSTPVSAIILDFFCTVALDVAIHLQIPSYFFYSASATGLNTLIRLPKLLAETPSPLKDLGDKHLHFPGLPPVPASHVPGHFLDPNGPFYSVFVSMYATLPKADGIIVNTFEALEKSPIDALAAETEFPPIYCVGPLPLASGGSEGERHACLTWLDAQPKRSVVFLCFGSMGTFPRAQLAEIAAGLEGSGQRFLWVVRSPPGEDPNKEVGELLPEGFLERTEGRGLVLKSWAPQTAVLSHESVGAFVSHCGWNSVLEAVSVGVPIIAWPLYAEQRLNKVYLVEAAKVAVELKGYDKEVVRGEEIEEKIKWLMETEGGEEVKERVRRMKESAEAATKEGGSSDKAWKELVKAIKKDN